MAAAHRPPPRLSLATASFLVAFLLIAASGAVGPAEGVPIRQRRFFTSTCWGWGASCSHYGSLGGGNRGGSSGGSSSSGGRGRGQQQAARGATSRSSSSQRSPFNMGSGRSSGRLPSPFTSSNWGAGTMGKRNRNPQAGNEPIYNNNNNKRRHQVGGSATPTTTIDDVTMQKILRRSAMARRMRDILTATGKGGTH